MAGKACFSGRGNQSPQRNNFLNKDFLTIKHIKLSMAADLFLAANYFGSEPGQYGLFLLSIIGFVIGAKIIYYLIKKYGSIIASKTETEFDDVLIIAIEKPLLFAGFIAGAYAGYQFLTVDAVFISSNFMNAIQALIILDIMWFALKIVDGIIAHFVMPLAAKTDSKLDGQFIPVIRKLLKASIIFISALVILSSFGINVLPLLAGLGISGLAIAFAAQKTVEDLFGGLSIFTSKPFVVGDMVKVAGVEGTVESIGLRYTRIRDLEGRLNTLPNSSVAQGLMVNISAEPSRKVSMTLGVTYGTSHEKMQKAIRILENTVKNHPDTDHKNMQITFKDYGDFSLNIGMIYFIKNFQDGEKKFHVMGEINLEIKKQFKKAGIEFAFPTQSIYIGKMPSAKK